MVTKHEFIRGTRYDHNSYCPRFCSTLPLLDVTDEQGSELQGELVDDEGYNSGGSLQVRSYVGGRVKRRELVLFRFEEEMMVNEPLVLSVVGKVETKSCLFVDIVRCRAKWRIVIRGKVETVEPLLSSTSDYSCVLQLGEDDDAGIAPFLHTRCGNGWSRWWWTVYPNMRDYHVTCLQSIALQCSNDKYEEGLLRMGCFYLNKASTHSLILKSDCGFLRSC